MAATAPVTLVQEKGDQYGILVFAPVYNRFRPDDVLGRRQALKGFTLGVLRVGDFISVADNSPNASPRVVIHVFDPAAPESTRQLHPRTPETTAEKLTRGLHAEKEFEVGGRTWLLVATPGPGFRDLNSSASAGVVLLFGLLTTGLYVLLPLAKDPAIGVLRPGGGHDPAGGDPDQNRPAVGGPSTGSHLPAAGAAEKPRRAEGHCRQSSGPRTLRVTLTA